MNTLNETPYSEMIYRFMDGETNSVQQKVLFDALASDAELQNEFQQAVSIAKGFNADKMVLIPPARLTNTLFQGAGFSAPMQFSLSGAAGLASKFKNFARPLISASVGALITALVFFTVYNPFDTANISSNSTNLSTVQTVNGNIPPVVTYSDNKTTTINENKGIAKSIVPIVSEEDNDITIKDDISIEEAQIISNENNEPVTIAYNDNTGFDNNIENVSFEPDVPEVDMMNIKVEVRGMTGLAFFPNRTIEPEPFSIMNNIGIGLKYKFNDNHSAGLVLGRESLQMYSYNPTGGEFKFNHEPNLFWAGASYRFTGDEIYGSFRPYGEVVAAGTKYGPLGKASLGISYNPENIFSMSVGLEGTTLMYWFQKATKHTEKLSVVYNIGIHF
ncbi:hypothetical protein ACFLSQ_00100 [Bacteroidota bacterium]